jgi:hypothetical protein
MCSGIDTLGITLRLQGSFHPRVLPAIRPMLLGGRTKISEVGDVMKQNGASQVLL